MGATIPARGRAVSTAYADLARHLCGDAVLWSAGENPARALHRNSNPDARIPQRRQPAGRRHPTPAIRRPFHHGPGTQGVERGRTHRNKLSCHGSPGRACGRSFDGAKGSNPRNFLNLNGDRA